MVRDDEVKDHDEMVRDFCAMSGAPEEVVSIRPMMHHWEAC